MPGVELAQAWVRIIPSMQGVQGTIAKEFAPVSGIAAAEGKKAGTRFGSGLASSIKGMVAPAAALISAVAIGKWLGDSVQAVRTWETINAQTSAVVKSTGGVANISAAQIHNLAQSIEAVTATQAESIQKGANMLLTFKNIRNEAGKGNDIFNQSTKVLVDMSRAMGSDPQTAAIQLGKALNDPVQGVTALTRVGVQFTDQQKAVIKSLVNSGNTMGAQKVILKELQSQFGGSGAAYAKTFTGQMYLLGDSVGDLGETLVKLLFPAFLAMVQAGTKFFGWVSQNLPLVGGLAAGFLLLAIAIQAHNVAMAVAKAGGFGAWIVQVITSTQAATAAQWLWNAAMDANPIGIIIVAIAALVAGLIWFFTQTELGREIWTNVTNAIAAAATWLWVTILQPVFTAIGNVFTWIFQNIIMPIVTGIVIYVGIWAAIFTWLWTTILQPVFAGIGQVFNWIYNNIIVPIVNGIVAYVKIWAAIFTWLWANIISPTFNQVGAIFNWVWSNVIRPVVDFISGAIRTVGDTVHTVFGGIASFIGGAFQAVLGVVRGPINGLIGLINGVIRGINSIHVTIPGWVPIVGGQTFGVHLPTIPSLADGGIVQPVVGGRLVRVAEARQAEVIAPLSDLRDELRNEGPTDLSDATIEKLARIIATLVRLYSRQGGGVNG